MGNKDGIVLLTQGCESEGDGPSEVYPRLKSKGFGFEAMGRGRWARGHGRARWVTRASLSKSQLSILFSVYLSSLLIFFLVSGNIRLEVKVGPQDAMGRGC